MSTVERRGIPELWGVAREGTMPMTFTFVASSPWQKKKKKVGSERKSEDSEMACKEKQIWRDGLGSS